MRFAAALLLLAGCAPTGSPTAIRVGTDVDASSLDPRLMRDTTGYRVVDLLYDGLVRLDRDLMPVPALATSWESPEPTRWVFHLREDARFHDGRALTSEDVVHTLETLLDPDFGAPLRSLYEPITRVEATDAHTVVIHLEKPYAPLLSYLDVGIVPREADELGRLGSRPIGTGPYRLKRWDRGSKILLEANRDYWGGPPRLDAIEIVVVPDNTARAQAFEAGDLDLIQSPLSPQDIRRLSADPRFKGHFESGAAITYFNFNTSRPPLDEPGVRRAISMLIDQETILNRIYEGSDERARSVLLPSSWAFSPDVAQPAYDPAGAESLLGSHGLEVERWATSDVATLNPLLSDEDVAELEGPLPRGPLAFVGESMFHADAYQPAAPFADLGAALLADGIMRPAASVLRIVQLPERADAIEETATDWFGRTLEWGW